MSSASHCGRRAVTTRASKDCPSRQRRDLSPPPMRRDWPPARIMPAVISSDGAMLGREGIGEVVFATMVALQPARIRSLGSKTIPEGSYRSKFAAFILAGHSRKKAEFAGPVAREIIDDAGLEFYRRPAVRPGSATTRCIASR